MTKAPKATAAPKTKPKRLRLSPEERKALILDATSTFIREHGIAALNLDRLARESGHSKPLIYAYFKSRNGLLEALLLREVKKRQKADQEAVKNSATMDDLIRNTARSLLTHVADSGTIVQQLLLEPEIAKVLQDVRLAATDVNVDYLAKRVAKHYNIPHDLAPAVVGSVLGIGTAAGAHFERHQGDIDQMEEIMVTLTKGALAAASRKFGSKKTKA